VQGTNHVDDTTISNLKHIPADNEQKHDFIYAFNQKVSQAMKLLREHDNFHEQKSEQLIRGGKK